MSTERFSRRIALALAATALFAAIAAAADDAGSAADPPAGQLLVASAAMQDPRFRHGVILLLRHDATGAFGIAINRLLGERPLAAVLAQVGADDGGDAGTPVEGTIRVFLGGPVQRQFAFVIHSTEYRRPETLLAGDVAAMTASKDVLRDIAHQKGPALYLFALGYAGWGAGQLEGEIARHDWFTAPAGRELIFDADRATVWDRALAQRLREM